MRTLFISLIISSIVLTGTSRTAHHIVIYGNQEDEETLMYHEEVSRGGWGGWTTKYLRFPEEESLLWFRISRIKVIDYNYYTADVKITDGGVKSSFVEFLFESRTFRGFDLEVFIYGVYEGPCHQIQEEEEFHCSKNMEI